MMSTIISNTRTKFGKYRPWVLIGCISNAIILVLMFTLRIDITNNPNLGWWNVCILGILYLLWGMTYTTNDVSYWSLLPVLSEDKKDRDNLTTMVAIFASIGAFTAGGLIPLFTTGNMIEGYRLFSIIFAIIFLICQLNVFFFTHDNKYDKFMLSEEEFKTEEKSDSISLKDMVKILIRNKQLLVMAVVVLFYTTASGFLTAFGQNFFYFKFGYDGNLVFIFTVIYAVGTLVSQSIFPILANKFKRANIVKYSIILTVLGYLAFFIVANLNMSSNICFMLFIFVPIFKAIIVIFCPPYKLPCLGLTLHTVGEL
jgi:melibiose permease/lactose/raffinose/galactose permease